MGGWWGGCDWEREIVVVVLVSDVVCSEEQGRKSEI